METVVQPSQYFSVNVGVTYLDAKYHDYIPEAGKDFSGNRLIRAPEWTVKSGADGAFRWAGSSPG